MTKLNSPLLLLAVTAATSAGAFAPPAAVGRSGRTWGVVTVAPPPAAGVGTGTTALRMSDEWYQDDQGNYYQLDASGQPVYYQEDASDAQGYYDDQGQWVDTSSGSDQGGQGGLLVGEAADAALSSMSTRLQGVGDEAGYLQASRERALAQKAEYEAREANEEAWAEYNASTETNQGGNFGPGDMSEAGAILVPGADGWEESLERDEDDIIGKQSRLAGVPGRRDEAGIPEEVPELYIPGGDNEDGDSPLVF